MATPGLHVYSEDNYKIQQISHHSCGILLVQICCIEKPPQIQSQHSRMPKPSTNSLWNSFLHLHLLDVCDR